MRVTGATDALPAPDSPARLSQLVQQFTDTLHDGQPGPFPELTAYILRTAKPSAWEGYLLLDRSSKGGPNLLITTDTIMNFDLGPGEKPLSTLRESAMISKIAPLIGFKARGGVSRACIKRASVPFSRVALHITWAETAA